MIPRAFITAWRTEAPWLDDAMVEQDLVISRALVELFQVKDIANRLAFRGGTALHKLHLQPGARYSEDIDLVQVKASKFESQMLLRRTGQGANCFRSGELTRVRLRVCQSGPRYQAPGALLRQSQL